MADAIYDAIVVGGGNKGLVLACYLAEYGGMRTAIFERRHELGGCWASEEFVPGFIGDSHATSLGGAYLWPMSQDFPDLKEKGGEWIPYKVAYGAIFREDDSCVTFYHKKNDRNQERTAKEIARFSEEDAETWLRLWNIYNETVRPALGHWYYNVPTPADQDRDLLDIALLEAARKMGGDASWFVKSPLEILREVFCSDEIVAAVLRVIQSYDGNPPNLAAVGLFELLVALPESVDLGCAKGGTHSYAHAAFKVFTSRGGISFSNKEVDKILVNNGRATGVRLADGSEIEAKQLVATDVDPYTVFFRFLGKEHVSPRMLRKIEHLSRRHSTITWYQWATHELPIYSASASNPDINDVGWLALISKDPEELVRIHARKLLGQTDFPESSLIIWAHTNVDPTRAPAGKHVIGTEDYAVPPASVLNEKEWRDWKEQHAKRVMGLFERHTSNIRWDKVIGYVPWTPIDSKNMVQTGPDGCWGVIDHLASKFGRFRPIPELAGYRTPIEHLYCTGAAWFPFGGGMCTNGYVAYKAIADDLGLRRPWEEKGRPY